jgi:acetyl esterase/lipase
VTDETTPRTFPAPQSVSAKAQEWLSMQLPASPYPDLDDTEAWLARIKASDEGLSMFIRADLPVESSETEIDGVRTYVVRAPDVPDDTSTPIYLDIHGGALISGGGEACRAMAAGSAMHSGLIHWAVD